MIRLNPRVKGAYGVPDLSAEPLAKLEKSIPGWIPFLNTVAGDGAGQSVSAP